VGGGIENTASGSSATVGGGIKNTASGNFSCVPGGVSALATNTGSFVFNGDEFERTASFADGTFTVRCEGGARFYSAGGTGVGVQLGASQGAWASLSDSNAKTKITAVDPRRILAKVASMRVTEWEYKAVPDRRYIGPMAQDFHTAFGLGSDDKSISTLDSDGVMYAAIQGLVEELKDRDAKIGELEAKSAEIDALKAKSAEIDQLKIELRAIREQMSQLPPSH
jgi:trimeric autotransporter adhesin